MIRQLNTRTHLRVGEGATETHSVLVPHGAKSGGGAAIGRVHATTVDAVHIGVSATDDAVLTALEEAFQRGLPLRLHAHYDAGYLAVGDLARVGALATGLQPRWRWLWAIHGTAAADLFHVQREGL